MQPTNNPHKGNLQLGKPLSSQRWVEYSDESWELTNGKTRCLGFKMILKDLPNITGTWVALNYSSVPTATGKSMQAFLIFLLHSFEQPTFTEGSHMIGGWDSTWPQAISTNTCLRTHICLTSGLLAPPLQMWAFSGCVMSASQASMRERARKRKEWTWAPTSAHSRVERHPGSRPG